MANKIKISIFYSFRSFKFLHFILVLIIVVLIVVKLVVLVDHVVNVRLTHPHVLIRLVRVSVLLVWQGVGGNVEHLHRWTVLAHFENVVGVLRDRLEVLLRVCVLDARRNVRMKNLKGGMDENHQTIDGRGYLRSPA